MGEVEAFDRQSDKPRVFASKFVLLGILLQGLPWNGMLATEYVDGSAKWLAATISSLCVPVGEPLRKVSHCEEYDWC